ncbi:MAG TPA: type III PLP-dependent enzyme [Acidimicrobiales bacterium]|nr:type III PLP-dependent enzyme [Acidimicrobiales bacterium]
MRQIDDVVAAAPVHPAIERFIAEHQPATPCLIVALEVVAERYAALAEALPETTIFYAIKANPEPPVTDLLARLGSSFDVASPAEIDLCLSCGVAPQNISYGNTIKKMADIAYGYRAGVRLFAFDSLMELEKLAVAAPGSKVFCRLLTSGSGADWPLSAKFGCQPDMAADLLVAAARMGLDPYGVSFHVGSQQRDPSQWDAAVASAARVFDAVAREGLQLRMLNLGGGFPAQYLAPNPDIDHYADAIRGAVRRHFGHLGDRAPKLVVEPGRYIAADAGVLLTEVVLVSRKSYGVDERWVYLDTGVFGGLAETLSELIKYRLLVARQGRPGRSDPARSGPGDGAAGVGTAGRVPVMGERQVVEVGDGDEPTGPVVLAGPTCDSLDVMYQHHRYQLPLDLAAGDHVLFLSAGAYTAAYCTDGFNGFEPMPVHCLPE